MPTLQQATQPVDTAHLEPIEFGAGYGNGPSLPDAGKRSMFLRAPLPRIDSSSDSLRQFYSDATIPQFRVFPPPTAITAGAEGAAGAAGPTGAQGPAGKDGGLGHRIDIPLTVNFTPPSFQQTGNVHLGRTFELLQVLVNSAGRVRLYSTTALRDADKTRSTSTAPALYAQTGLIFDLNLDSSFTFPVTWRCSPTAPGCDLNSAAIGDIAYTVDSYGAATGTGWSGLTSSVFSSCSGTEIARSANVTVGTLVRFNAGWLLPNTDYTVVFVDGGGAIVGSVGYYPNNAPNNTYLQAYVPTGATKMVAWSGTVYGSCTAPTHFSSNATIFEVAASSTIPAITMTFTELREEE